MEYENAVNFLSKIRLFRDFLLNPLNRVENLQKNNTILPKPP